MKNEQERSQPVRHLRRTHADWFGLAAMGLLMICSLALLIQLLSMQMLTDLYLIVIEVLLLLINAGHVIVQLPIRRSKTDKVICGAVAVLLSAAMLYSIFAVGTLKDVLSRISGKLLEKTTSYVLVMADDPARSIGDTQGYTFGILSEADAENTQALLEDIQQGLGTVATAAYETPGQLADALYDSEVGAIILNSGYVSALSSTDGYESFSEDTRIIYEFSTTREVEDPIAPNAEITTEPFVVYCSGIDARSSDINIQSLSDVNILAVIHPRTHQILLINTPRDYYVPLARNGQRDKLTHAGIYGIDESSAVLGSLYGVDVDYYARVNFFGLKKIVDALDGVDVISEHSFTTVRMELPDDSGTGTHRASYSFTEGLNHLNGEEALAFSRERKAFADGDNQRGRNQMAVIQAIVDKATSPSILKSYQKLLSAVSDAFITNLTYQDISSLVQMQLSDMSDWNITTYSVSGDGGMEYCYSMPGQELWVMWPDAEQINTAKNLIRQVMNGETPVLPKE